MFPHNLTYRRHVIVDDLFIAKIILIVQLFHKLGIYFLSAKHLRERKRPLVCPIMNLLVPFSKHRRAADGVNGLNGYLYRSHSGEQRGCLIQHNITIGYHFFTMHILLKAANASIEYKFSFTAVLTKFGKM